MYPNVVINIKNCLEKMYEMYIKTRFKAVFRKDDSPEFFLSFFLKKISGFSICLCCCQAGFEQTSGLVFSNKELHFSFFIST